MKPLPQRLIRAVLLLLAGPLLPTACSTGGGPAASPPQSVSIAVREFSAASSALRTAGDQGVRDFEKFYLPAQVIMALKRSAGVTAYFTMASTAATDFVADAVIQSSNGKRLSLSVSLTRVDGRKVFSKTYTVDHEDARERVLVAKQDQFYASISRDLVAKAKSTTISLPHARARAYAEDGGVVVNETVLADAQTAGEIERASILSPLTSALLPRAQIAAKVYTEWQTVTVPLQKDRSLAQYEQNVAAAGSVLALGMGAMSVAQSAQLAAAGNQTGVQLANQNLSRAESMFIGTETVRRTAANREQAIIQALNSYKNQFVSGLPRQLTVRIYNKLLTLHGSQQDMLREFKQVVKEKLHAS